MDSIDQQVLGRVQQWLQHGDDVYLCTIIKAIGSSPRPVGSLLALGPGGAISGSLSGGCVEDDLLDRLARRELAEDGPELVEYGVDAAENERLGLPCGGRLYVLVEKLTEQRLPEIAQINDSLASHQCCQRHLDLASGRSSVHPVDRFEALEFDGKQLRQTFGPRYLMLLIGAGQLARTLAEMAMMLDYRIVVCDPRRALIDDWNLPGVELSSAMPDDAVREWVQGPHCIVITLTHDPRIDDMALMEALASPAFYVGALGSVRTSAKRRQRLPQLGLSEQQIDRLHAPVGLSIGSKTPPEIAVAILAELTRLRRQQWSRGPAGEPA